MNSRAGHKYWWLLLPLARLSQIYLPTQAADDTTPQEAKQPSRTMVRVHARALASHNVILPTELPVRL